MDNLDFTLTSYDDCVSVGAAVTVDNGTFAWSNDVVLRNIKLKVPKGSLIAVIGPVGSGKSSLLSAILGEMDKISGSVNTVVSPRDAQIL